VIKIIKSSLLKLVIFRFVESDDSKDLYEIYYQTPKIKEMYERYLGVLFVDTTYCLNNIKYPALAMVVQDELGNSYPVCIILSVYERNKLLNECFKMFVTDNINSVDKTVAILIDKELKEDGMLFKNFPNARI
jgi:hypothetical protein